MKRILTALAIIFATLTAASAQEPNPDLVVLNNGADTVSVYLKQRNFGRFDRGLRNFLFIPKGQWMLGLTASYGELNTSDIEILSVLKDCNFSGKTYAIKPSVSYFWGHNQSAGLKLVYSRAIADLAGVGFDLGDDLSFNLRDVSYHSTTYTAAAFYRYYVGLSRNGRFGVFNEVEFALGGGNSEFGRQYNGEPRLTRTTIVEAGLNFSPGVCVFIMENVSFNVSFGVFGIKLHKEDQTTNGVEEGSRLTSGANFRFNLFNINFGLGVHI